MHRPTVRSVYLLAPVLLAGAIVATGCGSSHPEEAQVKQFFRASGLGDGATLANFAVVSFDPKTDGQVQSMTVESVSDPKVEPMKFKDLAKAWEDAQAADKEFSAKQKAYQDAHVDALKRVLAAEAANKKLSGADATVQTEWQKWRDDSSAQSKKVSEARLALQDSKPIAEMSLAGPAAPADLNVVEGSMESKDVTVNASVKMPDGSTQQKKLVVTMSRAVLKAAAGDKPGKWIFTGVKAA